MEDDDDSSSSAEPFSPPAYEATPPTRNRMQKVELVTMNGDVITTFTRDEFEGVRVEDFIDDLEQDDMIGVEGAKHDDLGVFVERFCLVIRDEIMQVDSCSHL